MTKRKTPNMKTFETACAQGDVHFTRVASIPAGLLPVKAESNRLLVTHSETGHHHVMCADHVAMFADTGNPFVCYLQVSEPTALEHLRPFDTHAPILFSPGAYEVRRQREYVPEGFRRVED